MTSNKIRRIFLLAFTWLSAIQVVGSLSMNRSTNHKLSNAHYIADGVDVQNNNDGQQKGNIFPRKEFFSHAANFLLFPAVATAIPGTAYGASPVTLKDTDSLGAIAKRKFRQKPPKVLRRKLSMEFAVLLMRSSYNALDTLDCVAMDQFQRDFFLIRSSEYQTYVNDLGAGMVQQGELSDPFYFDFISYAQYATINREITQNPALVFEEQQPIDQGEDKPMKFVPVVVKRDPSLTNAMLAPEHSRMVGSLILDRLEELFGQTDSAIPKLERNSTDSARLLAALKQLVNLFLVNGFAFGGNVSIIVEGVDPSSAKGAKFSISLNAPATLWGGKILQSEGAKVSNSFVTKAATELINRAGFAVSSSIKYDGTTEDISISIL